MKNGQSSHYKIVFKIGFLIYSLYHLDPEAIS